MWRGSKKATPLTFGKIINLKEILLFSRAASDLCSHDNKFIYGLAGIKGSRYCKK